MRKASIVSGLFAAALSLSACSGGERAQWQPSGNADQALAMSHSDRLIVSGVSADVYDATLTRDPALAAQDGADWVGHEIRTHDEGVAQQEAEIRYRLGRQF